MSPLHEILPIVKNLNKFPKINSKFLSSHVKNQMFELSREVHLWFFFLLYVFLYSIVYSSHARHVSTWLIGPAWYDEYTALVKSGNVASKHVWKAVKGAYCW